jgi:hypothetical protein
LYSYRGLIQQPNQMKLSLLHIALFFSFSFLVFRNYYGDRLRWLNQKPTVISFIFCTILITFGLLMFYISEKFSVWSADVLSYIFFILSLTCVLLSSTLSVIIHNLCQWIGRRSVKRHYRSFH